MTVNAQMVSSSLAMPRQRLMSPGLLAVLISAAGTSASLYLLLSTVPLYAATGPSGSAAAGLTSAAMMLSSVAAELLTPALVARFGYRVVFGLGVVLLGAPALALPLSAELALILPVSVLRGIGFGITVVVGAAVAALLAPARRRGESIGLYGVVSTIPAVVGLPLGVWLVGQIGTAPVFVLGGLSSVAMVAVLPWLPGRGAVGAGASGPGGVVTGLRSEALARPALAFAATTLAGGIVVTFLPLAATGVASGMVALALLVHAASSTITRWWAGRVADRSGAGSLLVPGLLVAAGGVGMIVVPGPATLIGGMFLFGAGFGVVQSASLNLMLDRVAPAGYSTASAVWNIAYDAGWGLGSVLFGLIVAQTGYPLAFGLTAGVVAAAVLPAWSDRRRPQPSTR
jgi:predicted MFS family arabinose efflux permease